MRIRSALLLTLVAASPGVQGQSQPFSLGDLILKDTTVVLELRSVSLNDGIRAVLGTDKLPIVVDRAITKRVSAKFNLVRWDVALRNLLEQANAIGEVLQGKYVVRPLKSVDRVGVSPGAKHLRPRDIVLGTTAYFEADVQLVLKELFLNTGFKCKVDPKLSGTITIYLTNSSFDIALSHVLRQADGAFRLEQGGYEIFRAKWRSDD